MVLPIQLVTPKAQLPTPNFRLAPKSRFPSLTFSTIKNQHHKAVTNQQSEIYNGVHAMPGSGTLEVTATERDGRVHVKVADTGVGMDEEALARAFEPYFSTKASGTGLGLPIAKRNVELSGGTIAVHSVRDRGTTVEISLPAIRG